MGMGGDKYVEAAKSDPATTPHLHSIKKSKL